MPETFQWCKNLKTIIIPGNIKKIGSNAFEGCSSVTTLDIQDGVTTIDASAFSGFNSLEYVFIPKSLTSINGLSFSRCNSLASIVVDDNNEIYDSRNNCNAIIITSSNTLVSGCKNTIIPNTVTSIGNYSFGGCVGLTTLTIPNSVVSIEKAAFQYCSNLSAIDIPSTVKAIDDGAFYQCQSLNIVNSEITEPFDINNNVFEGIHSDAILQVPYATKEKYSSLEGWNKHFREIAEKSNSLTLTVKSSGNGSVLYNGSSIRNQTSTFTVNEGTSTTITFSPDNGYRIKSVKENNTNVTAYVSNGTYTINSISRDTSIEVEFEADSQIISFADANVKAICIANWDTNGDGELSEQEAASVKGLGLVFKENKTITSFDELEYFTGLQAIPSNAFYDCSNLISVIIPNSVTTVGYSAFYGCSSLTSITIPNSVTNIGNRAFNECSGLNSITIPNSVTSIGSYAFYFCTDLTSITIPNSVTSIGMCAFYGCSNLKEVKSEINSPYAIDNMVFSFIHSEAILYVPNGTKAKYQVYEGWTKYFKEIIESTTVAADYTLSIMVTGNGSASYNSTSIRNNTQSFTVNEGTSATVTFTPDSGYRIKSVKLNSTDVTSSVSNNKYTISNISANTILAVTFEAIPATTYTLSITASGYGSASFSSTSVRNKTQSFTVNEGTSATVTFDPDTGYRIKSAKLNNTDVTTSVSNNKYTISNITSNTTLAVTFEAIPPTTYSLSITASGNGSASFNNTSIRNKTQSFTVNEGTSATVTFTSDTGYQIASVRVNNADVTAAVANNSYTISDLRANTTLEVVFEAMPTTVTAAGVNYTITSQTLQTVSVANGNYGQVLTVPATVMGHGKTWTVTGIETNAISGNTQLAAIIWNPEVAFTATVSNPNLLLYVKSSSYAPAAIQNVVVNGTASNIVLVEAKSGNNFYCPQMFTARRISYTHNYRMTTGIGESRGWETIALPFDVQSITHATKGEITPFAKWKSGDSNKPFWLYELTGSGFVEAGSIKAYTPYIISMPNNTQYDSQWLLNGNVTFAASNVIVGKTEDMKTATYQDRTFVPNYADIGAAEGLYALNVSNDFTTNNSGMTEGSKFVLNMRQVHPFEAYMTSSSNARTYFDIFDDLSTDIKEELIVRSSQLMVGDRAYDLQGRKVEHPSKKGVYIVNGKKMIIK